VAARCFKLRSVTTPLEDSGLIVQRLRYSETSLILTWLTAQHGLIKTLAKGAGKPGQIFYGKTDLYQECHLSWSPGRKSSLATLRSLDLISRHRGISAHYVNLLAVSYFYEIIHLLAEPGSPMPEIYDLYHKAIEYLQDHVCTALVAERFERRLLQIHGQDHPEESLTRLRRNAYPKQPRTFQALQAELKKNTANTTRDHS